MKWNHWSALIIIFLIVFFNNETNAQNRNFIVSLSLGAGNSGFKIDDQATEDKLKNIFYPMGGIQIQKKLSTKWALNIFPNVGMSGNKRILNDPIGNISKIQSTSAFVNLSIHPKYYLNDFSYFSIGPEVSYLIWNYGSTYNSDGEQLSNIKETDYFNRVNFLFSSSIGISKKVTESRKNAPIEIDALWFIEFRVKKGVTNILNKDFFGNEASSNILSFEIVTGISFASKN